MKDDHPLRQYNGLEGCMSGRMAMNTPWEVAKIDRELFGETEESTMTREEILLVSNSVVHIVFDNRFVVVRTTQSLLRKSRTWMQKEEYNCQTMCSSGLLFVSSRVSTKASSGAR